MCVGGGGGKKSWKSTLSAISDKEIEWPECYAHLCGFKKKINVCGENGICS